MILFVCTGNTCRSPLAEAIAKAHGVEAQSAGLYASTGDLATCEAVWAAQNHGMDLTKHWAQRVKPALLEQAEKVYVMTERHRDALCVRYPQYAEKVRVLEPEIPDPYGGSDAEYEQCIQSLTAAMERAGIITETEVSC